MIKHIKKLLLMSTLLLISPSIVHGYQSEIENEEVIIQLIAKHFNGELNLKRDEDDAYYAEYIFDGINVTLHKGQSFAWINGEVSPYKTTVSEGVVLPQYYTITKIWKETWVPVDLFIREFGYDQVGTKLVYDVPLGVVPEKTNRIEGETKGLPNSSGENDEEHADSSTENNKSNNDKPIPPNNVVGVDEKEDAKTNQEKNTEKESDTSKAPDNPIEEGTEENNNEEVEDDVITEEDSEEKIEENTLSLLGKKYKIGKHFSLKSSYPERQKYINEGNILTSWNDLRVGVNKATLILGQGNTTFRDLQGNLNNGESIEVVDAIRRQRTYSIIDKVQSELMDTNETHDELYDTYQNTNSIILQFQENNKMSFYVAS